MENMFVDCSRNFGEDVFGSDFFHEFLLLDSKAHDNHGEFIFNRQLAADSVKKIFHILLSFAYLLYAAVYRVLKIMKIIILMLTFIHMSQIACVDAITS